jgi:hypothetical protein
VSVYVYVCVCVYVYARACVCLCVCVYVRVWVYLCAFLTPGGCVRKYVWCGSLHVHFLPEADVFIFLGRER